MNPVTSLAYRWAIVAPALGLLGEFCLRPWAKGCRGGVPLNSGLPGVARGPGPHALAAPRRLSAGGQLGGCVGMDPAIEDSCGG